MKVTPIDHPSGVASYPGSVVVCVVSDGAADLLADCLRSVLAHTSHEVPIVVIGAEDTRDAVAGLPLSGTAGRDVYHYSAPNGPIDFADVVEVVGTLSEPADAVVLGSTCIVAAGWLEGLRDAAHSDSTAASATALTNHDVAVGSYEEAAAAIRTSSLRLRPPISSPTGCAFVRRSAFELVGLASSDRDDLGFFDRCVRAGLQHVLADDVVVFDRGQSKGIDAGDGSSPLARAVSRARRAINGLTVIIDGRILDEPTTGIQLHLLEIIAALARTDSVRLSVLVPQKLSEHATQVLQSLPALTLVNYDEASRRERLRADVVHRPFQVNDPGDVTFLASLGDRLVVTHHDLIGYNNPSYFRSREAWEGYRKLTRVALGTADQVLFPSTHGRDQALAEGLAQADRASVVPNGVDHRVVPGYRETTRPDAAAAFAADAEMLLCLGNDYRHKNRLFSLRILERLHTHHGWRGYLAFAGPHVANGSSQTEEARWLALHPNVAPFVLNLGQVSEAEKAWLLRRSRLVLYPTVYEGFGLVPFDAAEHGVPCMWAAGTSLSEVLPDNAAAIVPWNAEQTAERALELLHSDEARQRNVGAVRTAAAGLTWTAVAARLREVYEAACDAPPTLASVLARQREVFAGALSEDAMRLVGPGGALPADVERPLLAVATHRGISTTVFGALKVGYRISYKLRRWRAGGPGAESLDRQRRR